MSERKFDTIPDAPTEDNMADVFDGKLSAETEVREASEVEVENYLKYVEEYKFTNINSLGELYQEIGRLLFIVGDVGEHLDPKEVIKWIEDGEYEKLPEYNGLYDLAQKLKGEHHTLPYED